MDWMELPEREVAITPSPVTRADYARFAQETQRALPRQPGASRDPVTGVSADEASAFAAWLSQQDGSHYRLPTLEDMRAFAAATIQRGESSESAARRPHGEPRAALGKPNPLSEWLACAPDHGPGRDRLRCVTNLAWRSADGGTTTRGALADGRYSFVTFRIVRSHERG